MHSKLEDMMLCERSDVGVGGLLLKFVGNMGYILWLIGKRKIRAHWLMSF